MTNQITVWEPAPAIEYLTTCLLIPSDITLEGWIEGWQGAAQVEQSSRWWIGDLLNFGESRFPSEWTQVLDPQFAETNRGRARVSLRIPREIRRESLSWSAHREACSPETIEERIELLDLAEANRWGSREIAAEVKRRRTARQDNGGPPLRNDAENTFGTVEEVTGASFLVALDDGAGPGMRNLASDATRECLSEIEVALAMIDGGSPDLGELRQVFLLAYAAISSLI